MTIPAAFKFNNTITNNNVAIDDAMISALTDPINPFLLSALFSAVVESGFRKPLVQDANYYVSTVGSDSNNGLTPMTAFATTQHAINIVLGTLDFNGFNVTINVADGTYILSARQNIAFAQTGAGTFSIIGNIINPENCVLNAGATDCFGISNYAAVTINGFTFIGRRGLTVSAFATLVFGNIVFNTTQYDITNNTFGNISTNAGYTISSNNSCHINIFAVSETTIQGRTIIINSPIFSIAFVNVTANGVVNIPSNTFTGAATATGVKFLNNAGGGIITAGAGVNALPGSIAGTTTAPGWYI